MSLRESWLAVAEREDKKAAELEKFGLTDAAKVHRQNAERARKAAKQLENK